MFLFPGASALPAVCLSGELTRYHTLPFALSLIPWVFTHCVKIAVDPMQCQGLVVLPYLAPSAQQVALGTQQWLQNAAALGFTINWEKSSLFPSQQWSLLALAWTPGRCWPLLLQPAAYTQNSVLQGPYLTLLRLVGLLAAAQPPLSVFLPTLARILAVVSSTRQAHLSRFSHSCIGALHGEHCMGSTAWGALHEEHCLGSTAWGALPWEHCMEITAWGALHGEQYLGSALGTPAKVEGSGDNRCITSRLSSFLPILEPPRCAGHLGAGTAFTAQKCWK